jgi:hypothetical protein
LATESYVFSITNLSEDILVLGEGVGNIEIVNIGDMRILKKYKLPIDNAILDIVKTKRKDEYAVATWNKGLYFITIN